MFSTQQYELLDFGDARKLELFAGRLIDRPAPVATSAARRRPELWSGRVDRFQRIDGQGRWEAADDPPEDWVLQYGPLRFALKWTEFGQVGVFPEQAGNWDWIQDQLRRAGSGRKVLNLFAYTGGSTLAAAAAGAEVTHVDAARPVVTWARRNAALSGLDMAPVRWITEDARKFVAREARRGNRYDAIILDPPTYGHGPNGQAWQIATHLGALLRDCAGLLRQPAAFMLLTCHTPEFAPARVGDLLRSALGSRAGTTEAASIYLHCADGRRLPAGTMACWTE